MSEYRIIRFGKTECHCYYASLLQLFVDNVHAHAYMDSYSDEDGREKIQEMVKYVESNMAVVFGCVNGNDDLIGFVWAYEHSFREEKRMYISVLQVQESYRGRGIGTALLSSVEEEARQAGLSSVYIHTEAYNQGAVRLYMREGFEMERLQLRKSIDD